MIRGFKTVSTTDPLEVCREVFNCHDEALVFVSVHPLRNRQHPTTWLQFRVPPEAFLFLPHGYYKARFESEREFREIAVIVNFGDAMLTINGGLAEHGNRGTPEERARARSQHRRYFPGGIT